MTTNGLSLEAGCIHATLLSVCQCALVRVLERIWISESALGRGVGQGIARFFTEALWNSREAIPKRNRPTPPPRFRADCGSRIANEGFYLETEPSHSAIK